MNNNILVVDDEKEIRDLLEINLTNEGYNVFKAKCGKEALEILEREEVNLMVLDIMMPDMDGLEVCKRAREKYSIPILMLSAKVEDMDRIEGIMTGADNIIRIESMVIDKKQHKVMIDGNDIDLTAREFEILYLLASNRGRVFSAEEIFEKVWKERYYQSNNTVMVHMSRLRDKIEKYMEGSKVIHTVWGVGYKIEK